MSSPRKMQSPSDERARGTSGDPSQGITGVRRAVIYAGTRLFNPLTRRFAGSRGFPPFALVRHRGRRSGHAYATPVGARPTPEGFVIPLTFGKKADWFRNVQAAGECVIRWRGADYSVVEPELIDWETARLAFSPVERIVVPLLGITHFVRLRHTHARENGSYVE